MSSCCDSLERICIRTSGQQLNCWLDGGLKSGDRRVSISSCSDCILLFLPHCIPLLRMLIFMLYQIPIAYYCSALLCYLSILLCSLYSTTIYTTLLSIYYLGPQMPHLRKENRQLDVHSLFIFYYSFRSSISLLFDKVLALFSSRTIILVHCIIPIRPFCPSPPPPTATSLSHLDLTLDSLSLFSLVYFALCSLFSLSLSLFVDFLPLSCLSPVSCPPLPRPVTGRIVTRLSTEYIPHIPLVPLHTSYIPRTLNEILHTRQHP